MARWKIILLVVLMIVWSYCSIKTAMLFFMESSAKLEGYIAIFIQCFIEVVSVLYILTNLYLIRKDPICKSVLVWLCFASFITMINAHSLFHSMRDMMWWPLIYLLFYIVTIKANSDEFNKLLTRLFIPASIIINVCIFISLRSISFNYVMAGVDGFQSSNQVFFIALLLPFCFIYNDKRIKYSLLLIIIFSILISFKRSALIYAFMSLMVALFFDFLKKTRINPILRLLFPVILFFAFYSTFEYVEEFTGGHIWGRIENIQSDGGSGRAKIYERMIDYYINESFISQLFGIGFDNAKFVYLSRYSNLLSAHNDFLEMLIDFGIIGLFMYIVVIKNIFRLVNKSNLLGNNYYQANIVAFLCFVVMSMVSHLFIYPTYCAYILILWGITAGKLQKMSMKNNLNH